MGVTLRAGRLCKTEAVFFLGGGGGLFVFFSFFTKSISGA